MEEWFIKLSGKRILNKSTLKSLPQYWFQLYRILERVSNFIEKIKKKLFWKEDKKLHLFS